MESEDSSVQKWIGRLTPPAVDYSDYVPIFFSRISGAFFRFYLYLLSLAPEGISVWWETQVLFETEDADEEIQTVPLPMRLRRVYLYDSHHQTLNDLISGQMHDIVARVQDLVHSGSDWLFKNVVHCEAHVSKNINGQFNNIGWSRTERRMRRKFGNQTSFHLNSKNKHVFSRHLISLCSDVGDCFLLCLGMSLDGTSKEQIAEMKESDSNFDRFKSRLRTLVAQTYDIRSCSASFPISLHQIESFKLANKGKVCLNIYGFYLDKKVKSRIRYVFFPVSVSQDIRDDIPSVTLVITHRSENGEYHLNLCHDYQAMLRNSVFYKSEKIFFCRFCCSGHNSFEDQTTHEAYCSEGESCLIFPRPTERLVYEQKKKASPVVSILAGDIETKLAKSDISFGSLSSTRGKLEPLMIGFSSKFLVHEDIFPNTCPIILEGPKCVDNSWKWLRFEIFYLNAIINQQERPMERLSFEQKKAIQEASHCANCHKYLNGHGVSHHCHIQGEFLSQICKNCNQILAKLETLSQYYHHLQFDANFLIQSLNSEEAKRHIAKTRIFAKEAQKVMKIDIVFRCFICHPDELPSEAELSELAVFPHRESEMRTQLRDEFCQKMEVVKREIEFQKETLKDVSLLEIAEEGDEGEDDFDYDNDDDDNPSFVTVGNHDNDDSYHCRHYAAFFHRRVCIKDSLMLIRASLDKSLREMYTTALQPNRCDAFPAGSKDYPEAELWLGEPKQCACCITKHAVKKDASDVTHFATHGLGGFQYAPKLLRKLNHFPYSMLKKGIVKIKAKNSWPLKKTFKNSLRDFEEISDSDYNSLKEDCFSIGIKNGYSLLLYYLHCDILGLINLLNISSKYLYQNFGLNLLRLMSISRFGYEVILKTASEAVGSVGLEYVPSEKLYRMYRGGGFGGFLTCNRMGNVITPNHIYNPNFDVEADQSLYANLDISSFYGSVLLASFPYTDHQHFDDKSNLVQDMNRALDSGTLFQFIANMRFSKDLHIFMNAVLTFPPEVQLFLREFVPVVGRKIVRLNDLSFEQRKYAEQLQIPISNRTPINVADFSQQTCMLTAEYVETLVGLGVQVLKICEVSTSQRFPIFKPIIEKMLRLKNETQLSFKRNWMKLLNNSCFGFLMLRVESHNKSRLASNSKEIKKILERPDLDHLTLISPTQLLAYLKPPTVHYRYA